MSDERPSDHPPPPASSPFAPSPSARPPSAEEIRVQVRVPAPPSLPMISTPLPAPGGSMPSGSVPVSPVAPTIPAAIQTPLSAPAPAPFPPAPPPAVVQADAEPAPKRPWIILAAAAGGALLVGAVGFVLFARSSQAPATAPSASASASASADVAPSPPPAVVAEPSATASAAPEPTASTSAAPSASHARPPGKPFDPAAARAALDAVRHDLAACKIPRTAPAKANVTFAPDGKVTAATPLAPYAGTPKGKCVAAALKKAHVHAFSGPPGSIAYTYAPK